MTSEIAPLVDAAQRVAGVVAARGRGDLEGARSLMGSFDDLGDLSGGALLVAELALGLLAEATGESLDHCVGDLSLRLCSIPD